MRWAIVVAGLMPVLTIDRTVFFLFFFLADLSYVGFVLVGDVLDIQRWKTNFTFCVQK